MKNSILRMSLVLAVVALSVAVFSAPASAQFYFGGKGTAFLPNNSGLEDFDTGFGGEAFAGYRFMPFFGLETGVGYYQSKWSDSENFEGINIDAKATAAAVPVTLTAKGFLPLGDKARLYAGAGIGVYFAKLEVEGSAEFLGFKETVSLESATPSAFGYHAVLGGEFMLSPAWGLQAEAKWFRVEPDFSFDDPDLDDKYDIGGIMISFGVLFQL